MFSFIHISDLHIGKRINNYDLHEDQEYILNQIVTIVRDKKPDAVLIAGDVYDKTSPSEDATALLNDFIMHLHETGSEIVIISGNHDPAEKLSYLSGIVDSYGLHIIGGFSGKLEKRSIGNADIYMLPYIRVADARRFFPDKDIQSIQDAMIAVLNSSTIDEGRMNILVTHQFVANASMAGSEDMMVGGESSISSSVLSKFDYVALGHIHRAQSVDSERIRYSGSPLKYSASEKESKVVLFGRISDDKEVEIEEIKLSPLHDVMSRKGSFQEIISSENTDDYVYVILTDETDVPDASSALSAKFPRFISMSYCNSRTMAEDEGILRLESEKEQSPIEYYSELFEMITKKKMSAEQEKIIKETIDEIWGNV